MIGNLLLRHRKLVPCPKPASACSSAPRRLRPKSSLFFASISKTQISRNAKLPQPEIRGVSSRRTDPHVTIFLLFRHSRMLEAGIQANL